MHNEGVARLRSDFTYDHDTDAYTCPAGKELKKGQKVYRAERPLVDEDGMMRYRASKLEDNVDVGTFATATLAELGYKTRCLAIGEAELQELAKNTIGTTLFSRMS